MSKAVLSWGRPSPPPLTWAQNYLINPEFWLVFAIFGAAPVGWVTGSCLAPALLYVAAGFYLLGVVQATDTFSTDTITRIREKAHDIMYGHHWWTILNMFGYFTVGLVLLGIYAWQRWH